ncbi:probable protein phosphatase 2C 12 [Macadamia integrifolia]|uniref:probable protein phosphatase 2C 12 n=1 Tax=Macadamia integrifolia TaxID=60698 RepID=UPI001C53051F|nr:probable protein phosphatase 2C 12 [Macadamia integrifolia]
MASLNKIMKLDYIEEGLSSLDHHSSLSKFGFRDQEIRQMKYGLREKLDKYTTTVKEGLVMGKMIKCGRVQGGLYLLDDGCLPTATASTTPHQLYSASSELNQCYLLLEEAVQEKGLRDNTGCIVVDILPPEKTTPTLPPKKPVKGVFKAMFHKRTSESSSYMDKGYVEPDVVEEIYEEGSAILAKRLDTEYPLCNMFKLFMCVVCQIEMKPRDGISVHANTSNPRKVHPWDGPFLCLNCQAKKEAMEGKRPSGGTISLFL